jgi:hypothetical protein
MAISFVSGTQLRLMHVRDLLPVFSRLALAPNFIYHLVSMARRCCVIPISLLALFSRDLH